MIAPSVFNEVTAPSVITRQDFLITRQDSVVINEVNFSENIKNLALEKILGMIIMRRKINQKLLTSFVGIGLHLTRQDFPVINEVIFFCKHKIPLIRK